MKLFGIAYGKYADKFVVVQAADKQEALNKLADSAVFQYQPLEVDRDIEYAMITRLDFEHTDIQVVYDGDE